MQGEELKKRCFEPIFVLQSMNCCVTILQLVHEGYAKEKGGPLPWNGSLRYERLD